MGLETQQPVECLEAPGECRWVAALAASAECQPAGALVVSGECQPVDAPVASGECQPAGALVVGRWAAGLALVEDQAEAASEVERARLEGADVRAISV